MIEDCFQIAIDGPAASGKSSVALEVAHQLGGYFVSTGDMFRAVTRAVLDAGLDPSTDQVAIATFLASTTIDYEPSQNNIPALTVNGQILPDHVLRSAEVTAHVSTVAALQPVRDKLLEIQRTSRGLGVVVMEGRDIGTVVFPDAKYKFYVHASPEERSRRRLLQDGEAATEDRIAAMAREIAKRDQMDANREIAPLRKAPDAIDVDTTHMSLKEVVARIVGIIREGELNRDG